MKKILIISVLALLQIQLSYASSGRTNSSGCHSSKKGGYHCHGVGSSSYTPTPTPSLTELQKVVDTEPKNTDNNFLDPNNIKETNETATTIPTENKVVLNNVIEATTPKDKSVMEQLNQKIEDDSKILSNNMKMKKLFGFYIGESINTESMNQVGKLYELNEGAKIKGFDKYYINTENKKLTSILSNKVINNSDCEKEKEKFNLNRNEFRYSI